MGLKEVCQARRLSRQAEEFGRYVQKLTPKPVAGCRLGKTDRAFGIAVQLGQGRVHSHQIVLQRSRPDASSNPMCMQGKGSVIPDIHATSPAANSAERLMSAALGLSLAQGSIQKPSA